MIITKSKNKLVGMLLLIAIIVTVAGCGFGNTMREAIVKEDNNSNNDKNSIAVNNNKKTTDTIIGTFKDKEGNLLMIFNEKKAVDSLVYASLIYSEQPWLIQTVILDKNANTIFWGNETPEYCYEVKRSILKISNQEGTQSHTFQKLSDNVNENEILSKRVSSNDLCGIYKLEIIDKNHVMFENDRYKFVETLSKYKEDHNSIGEFANDIFE